MKKTTILLVFLITFSMLAVFSPKANTQSTSEQLTTNPYKDRQPSWSADGAKIFYSAFSDSWYRHIWVMNSDGSGKTQLTSGNVVDENPALSPDGTNIVFTRWGFRGDYSDIMMMNTDGTNIQRLTFGSVPSKPEGTYNGVEWSQDGIKLIFMYIEGTTGTPWEVRKFWICTMKPDGTDLLVLGRGIWPKFVLGDTKILFSTELPEFMIAIMNADGTDIQILTSGPADSSPDMATSSHRIVFTRASAYGELGDLYIMDMDGSNQLPLLADGQNVEAYWSPDEKYVAYTSEKSGNYDIWKMEVPSAVRAWKDDTSLGLENDRLLLHGSAVAGNYLWFFDYLIFKDTGTMWYQPWDELAIIVYPIGSLAPWVIGGDYHITAVTEADKAYLTYSITKDNLKQDVTYTIYPSEPFIHVTFSITNIGYTIENTWAGVQFTTWIAGDYANDYYYVPGYGERQFTGTTNDIQYTDATETWVATWDQNKEEGVGILSTEGFDPSNIMSIDWGVGEGFRFSSESFNLSPGQSSETYDCYLYFFTGIGWQKTKDFYERALTATVDIDPDTLNLKSKGNWITAYVELPEGYDANDINTSTVLLNDTISAEVHPTGVGDEDNDGVPDLMVKFDRAEVKSYILANIELATLYQERSMNITLTVTGNLNDETPFEGSDTIRIMMPGQSKREGYLHPT